jgi:hypothetical protein
MLKLIHILAGYTLLLFLLGSLSMYAENCDKSVLKRLLKQLWRIVMKSLERNVVLPPMSEKVNEKNDICGYLQYFVANSEPQKEQRLHWTLVFNVFAICQQTKLFIALNIHFPNLNFMRMTRNFNSFAIKGD